MRRGKHQYCTMSPGYAALAIAAAATVRMTEALILHFSSDPKI
jgi:hypothetical protein